MVQVSSLRHVFPGRDAPALGVHAVPADADDLARLFGGETTDNTDKFAATEWREGPHGVPILARCENWFVGRVLKRVHAGDHDAFLLEPIAGESGAGDAFSFHRAKRISPGHEA